MQAPRLHKALVGDSGAISGIRGYLPHLAVERPGDHGNVRGTLVKHTAGGGDTGDLLAVMAAHTATHVATADMTAPTAEMTAIE